MRWDALQGDVFESGGEKDASKSGSLLGWSYILGALSLCHSFGDSLVHPVLRQPFRKLFTSISARLGGRWQDVRHQHPPPPLPHHPR